MRHFTRNLLALGLTLSLGTIRPAHAQVADTVLYSFNSASGTETQSYSTGRLALGKDGNYYGTTFAGGLYGYGTLFKISPSGQLTVLHNFTNGNDGANPTNVVVFDSKGNIYGDAANGAYSSFGVTYEYSPSTDTFTTLHFFTGPDGDGPNGVLLIGNNLYGVTYYGGIGGGLGNGVVYKIGLPTATRSLTFKVLHYFSGTDGENLWGPLVEGSDKYLYGTTGFGANGEGTVFQISPDGRTFNTLHSFSGPDGAYPVAGLIEGSDGLLYGTTADGGPSWTGSYTGNGTVFQISRDGSVFNTLHAFDGSDGADPLGVLLQATDGLLYGTTRYGGPGFTGHGTGGGTAFQISLNGSVFNSLYSFGANSTDAANPICGLREGPDGNLYGISGTGGSAGSGTVYLLSTQLPIIKGFSPTSGSASGATIVTVRGVNLAGASVTIAGVSQTVLSSSATTVKFQLNTATPTGSYSIIVTTTHGTATSAKLFTVTS